MNWKPIVAVFALLTGSGAAVAAQSHNSGAADGLVGTWLVQITPRNCTSGAPAGASFNALVTFHRGGTISEGVGSLAFAPGSRTAGHGKWSQQPGGTYLQEMIVLILFDTAANLPGAPGFDPTRPVTPGFLAGSQTVTHTVTHSGDDLVSSGTNAFYNTNGVLYRSGCSTATGRRF